MYKHRTGISIQTTLHVCSKFYTYARACCVQILSMYLNMNSLIEMKFLYTILPCVNKLVLVIIV